MTDSGAGRPEDRARPDHEATLNEAGLEVFAVDGTDSFSVPGPADGRATDGAPLPPPISRTRILVTAGAVISGLAFVLAVGAGSAEDPSLRTGDESAGPGFSTPLWRTDDGEEVDLSAVRLEPYDDETLSLLEEGRAADEAEEFELDDEYLYDDSDASMATASTFAPTDTLDPFDDDFFDSYDYDDDDDFSTYRPSYTVPRRVTSPRRGSIVTVPRRVTTTTTTTTAVPTTTTTVVATTTTEATTTTVEATTTSSSAATTTTQPPVAAWEAATRGLPACPAALHVWARGDGLVAAAGGSLFQRTDGDWSPLGGALTGASRVSAFLPGAADSTYWVGTDAGVFAVVGGTVSELGALTDVRSLAVAPNGTSLLAVTGTAQLHRWDPAATPAPTWTAVSLPAPAAGLGHVMFLDDTHAVLGTDAGVLRSDDGGQTWTSVSSAPVVGRPVQGQNTFYWLLAGGAGVLRSTALDGLAWTPYAGDGAVAADATALVVRPNQLVTWGDPAGGAPRLIGSTDGGAGWTPIEPTTPYRPDGLVHVDGATYVFSADCAAGAPGGADSVLRLADP